MGLEGVEIVMAAEEAFDIQIEDSEAEKLLTPRLLIDFVQRKVSMATSNGCLPQRSRWIMTHKPDLADAKTPGWTRDQIAARAREIIADVLGCKPDFSDDTHFVKDLGMG